MLPPKFIRSLNLNWRRETPAFPSSFTAAHNRCFALPDSAGAEFIEPNAHISSAAGLGRGCFPPRHAHGARKASRLQPPRGCGGGGESREMDHGWMHHASVASGRPGHRHCASGALWCGVHGLKIEGLRSSASPLTSLRPLGSRAVMIAA